VAREQFGVVLTEHDDPQIDEGATRDARGRLRTVERPMLEPMVPGASRWLEENMREQDEYFLNPSVE
jgi:hypothetical protein